MMMRLAVLFLIVAVAASASVDDSTTALRGHHTQPNFRFRGDAVVPDKAPAAPRKAKPGKYEVTQKTSSDNTAREGLGENLPYPGIDYLGTGYDLIKGNPDGDPKTQLDPGFRRPVVALEYSQDAPYNTRDLRDLQPLRGYAQPEKSCNQASSAQTVSSMSDYSSNLEAQASVSAGVDSTFASGSFSASAGMSSFKNDVLASDSFQFVMRSFCLRFKAGLDETGQKPVTEFDRRAKELSKFNPKTNCGGRMVSSSVQGPDGKNKGNASFIETAAQPTKSKATATQPKNKVCQDNNEYKKWEKFFMDFGTHFISELHLGGKMTYKITMTEDSKTAMEKSGVNVAAEIAGSYGPVSAKASVSVNKDTSQSNSFKNSKKTVTLVVLGGVPPSDPQEGFGEWAESVETAPMPVMYKFLPLYYSGSAAIDKDSYRYFVRKYTAAVMSGTAAPSNKITDRKPPYLNPGESWLSTQEPIVDTGRNMLKLEKDGRFTITSRRGTVLWDSMYTEVALMTTRPSTGAFELKFMKNGNLVLQRKEVLKPDEEPLVLWQSITSMNSCNSKAATKVEFVKGELTVKAKGQVLWTSGTAGPQRAKAKFFGSGQNKCVQKCVTLYADSNFKGASDLLSPFPVGTGLYDKKALEKMAVKNEKTSSLKLGLAPYKKTDSVISKAGIDGAACILHAWDMWELDRKSGPGGNENLMSKWDWITNPAGTGTASIFGWGNYDVFTRDAPQSSWHQFRNGKKKKSWMANDQIGAVIVQLAHDVQRWRCLDGARASPGLDQYVPCEAYDVQDGIMPTFDEFENRLGTYFSNGCPTAMKMPQCTD